MAAGLGTRMLPATKAVPKVMLPLVDKPIIQYSVEEAVASGITDITLVIGPDQEEIIAHFGGGSRAEAKALAAGNRALLEAVRAPERLATFHFVEQAHGSCPAAGTFCMFSKRICYYDRNHRRLGDGLRRVRNYHAIRCSNNWWRTCRM